MEFYSTSGKFAVWIETGNDYYFDSRWETREEALDRIASLRRLNYDAFLMAG